MWPGFKDVVIECPVQSCLKFPQTKNWKYSYRDPLTLRGNSQRKPWYIINISCWQSATLGWEMAILRSAFMCWTGNLFRKLSQSAIIFIRNLINFAPSPSKSALPWGAHLFFFVFGCDDLSDACVWLLSMLWHWTENLYQTIRKLKLKDP